MGSTQSGSITSTTEPYPANCTYYCLWMPGGASSLDIGISGFEVDLDLYVGYGDISLVLGAEPGDSGWLSNSYGTGDELVSIPNPGSDGAYYIEVCSYDGQGSNFQIQATTR